MLVREYLPINLSYKKYIARNRGSATSRFLLLLVMYSYETPVIWQTKFINSIGVPAIDVPGTTQ